MENRFYRCKYCGNLVGLIDSGGGELTCCGQPMELLVPGSVDAAAEKHLPVIEAAGKNVTVKVGEIAHPMLGEHFIEWIYLLTEQGGQRKALKSDAEPAAVFCVTEGDKVLGACAYCNLHGLWMTKV